jgi:hypothetical protein
MESEESKRLKARIKELEKEIEFADLKTRAYQIMFEIAEKEYGIDLKKISRHKKLQNPKKKGL